MRSLSEEEVTRVTLDVTTRCLHGSVNVILSFHIITYQACTRYNVSFKKRAQAKLKSVERINRRD